MLPSVEYLGYVIDQHGLHPTNETTKLAPLYALLQKESKQLVLARDASHYGLGPTSPRETDSIYLQNTNSCREELQPIKKRSPSSRVCCGEVS